MKNKPRVGEGQPKTSAAPQVFWDLASALTPVPVVMQSGSSQMSLQQGCTTLSFLQERKKNLK